ncbi:MAG: sigma-70 family RNA polymerase sigma factor [Planctomycetes bacterium]|nr:sigma-70 family RNA polymerase sigma factor [Planctomycetota bacterium]
MTVAVSATTTPRARPRLPTALSPSPSFIRSLEPANEKILAKLLREPTEFVDHDAFYEPNATLNLLGVPAKLTSAKSTRFADPVSVLDPARSLGSRMPTLRIEQEQLLFQRYNYTRMRMLRILDEFAGRRITTRAARHLLAWAAWTQDIRSMIVTFNIPLVLAMAKRARFSSIDFNDMVSEGNMALLRSVDKFDCARGFKFSTYSCRAILKSFSRVVMRVSRYRGQFPVEFDPSIEKSDYLERKRIGAEEDCVEDLKEILLRNEAGLNEVEQTVIRERFALAPPSPEQAAPKTLEQVGLIIGVTKERVRQIQNKALRKIRQTMEEEFLAA